MAWSEPGESGGWRDQSRESREGDVVRAGRAGRVAWSEPGEPGGWRG